MAKDVVITLHVDANKITQISNPSQHDIDNNCEFSDNNHGRIPNGSNPKDFESVVFKNKKVKWMGQSDHGFDIAITEIDFKSGTQLFKHQPPFRGNNSSKSTIEEQLQNKDENAGKEEVYSIYFKISKDREEWGPYYIDPKLKMSRVD